MSDLTGTGITFIVVLAKVCRRADDNIRSRPISLADHHSEVSPVWPSQTGPYAQCQGPITTGGRFLPSFPHLFPRWPSVPSVPSSVFPLNLSLSIPHTHAPQATCPECVREKVRQHRKEDIAVCCTQQRSSDTSPQDSKNTPLNPTANSTFTRKHNKSLNVTAIAIGVIGAVLLLVVCVAIIFYQRKKKQRKKLPPSAEFMDAVVIWQPRILRETASPISSFAPKDTISFASTPFEPVRCNIPAAHYSPTPSTPPWSS